RRVDEKIDRPRPAPAVVQSGQFGDDASLSFTTVFVGERLKLDEDDVVDLVRKHAVRDEIDRAQERTHAHRKERAIGYGEPKSAGSEGIRKRRPIAKGH